MHHLQKPDKPFNLPSFVALVMTSCIGADIYIIIAQTSQLSGSFSIWAWLICGFIAIVIALCFGECANLINESGGSFIYVEKAFGHFWGFMTGWILYLSEWAALIIFPIAFVQYTHYFFNSTPLIDAIIKIAFIGTFTFINIKGAKITVKADNIITILKLTPLILLIILAIVWFVTNPQVGIANISVQKPDSYVNFGEVILLAFWAFAGFEMSVLPSNDIQNAKKTIPRGLMIGVFLVMVFYILVNLSVFLVLPEATISGAKIPLATVMSTILNNSQAGIIIIAGGLISISGITLATIFELSRLLQKMASEGLFPKLFAKMSGKENVPVTAIIFQSLIALIVSLFADMPSVIGFSMILIATIYLMTGLANWKLHSNAGHSHIKFRIVAILTVLFSAFLILQGNITEYAFSIGIIVFGVIWYEIRRPHIKKAIEKIVPLVS